MEQDEMEEQTWQTIVLNEHFNLEKRSYKQNNTCGVFKSHSYYADM